MNQVPQDTAFYPDLKRYLQARLSESDLIPAERGPALERVRKYISERMGRGVPVRLIFICTHNSRRSQMAQIWAQAAARIFSVSGVHAFSGGTEVTAFDPRAVSAMVRAGFRISHSPNDDKDDNPTYHVHAGEELTLVHAFSKAYPDPPNPGHGFCAILTCSRADRECPVITSADERVLMPYEDPKGCDGTDREAACYDATCREVCREMAWVFARVAAT